MRKSKNRSLKLGLLVSVGLLLFILSIYYLGSKQNLFSSTITVQSTFTDVKGLVEGNKVRYAGINVGTVSNIKIISDSTILVEMDINEKVIEFIRKDAKVEIGQEGLMGNKIVYIHTGSAEAGSVEDNDKLESVKAFDVAEILEEAKKIIGDGRSVSENLLEMSEKMNNGDGDLAKLLNENSITTKLNESGDQLLSVAKNVDGITQKINQGQGDLGRLVNDTTITYHLALTISQLDSIASRTDSLTKELLIFGKELNNGNGLATRLVYDSIMAENADTAIAKMNSGIDDVVKTSQAVRESWILNLFSGRNKKKNRGE
jgi:phospholipid/cholesterol/gamma-HCH transport system substrate-binding protein